MDISLLARGGPDSGQIAGAGVPRPKARWKTRVFLPGLLLAGTLGVVGYAARETFVPTVAVEVAPVLVREDVDAAPAGTVVVQAPGWVEADPFAMAVSALADGIVEDVLVLEGARVSAGQVVARLVRDDAELLLREAEAELGLREAERAAAEARLREARRNWEHPIELRRKLETAQAELAEKRAELERWPSELARDLAHVEYMRAELERVRPLREIGQASEIELVRAKQNFAAQQAIVAAQRKREPILKAQVASLEAEVAAAAENLALRIADERAVSEAEATLRRATAAVALAEAKRDTAALELERMEVRSPTDGVVMTRLVEPGSKVLRGMDGAYSAQIVRLYDPEKLQVRVDIPLVEAAKVGVGQRAEVIVDVLPNRVFDGHVTRVVHEADVQKNTLQVKVAIESPSEELKPEMLARARFLAAEHSKAQEPGAVRKLLFVPASALQTDVAQPFVWLADTTTDTARRRGVTRGRTEQDGWIAITDGLQSGDRVIINPPSDLKDGARIRIEEN